MDLVLVQTLYTPCWYLIVIQQHALSTIGHGASGQQMMIPPKKIWLYMAICNLSRIQLYFTMDRVDLATKLSILSIVGRSAG